MMGFLKDIGISSIADIALMSTIIYLLLVWFRRSKAVFVLGGILIVGFVYILARHFNLLLTAAILQGFFAVILLASIIIFQEDLKYLFERLASGLKRKNHSKGQRPSRIEVEILARTLTDLANDRIGALIVLKGTDIIDRHLTGGVDLNGELSEAVLKSIFDPNSIGHDGAVVIERDQILKFSTHLPLSKDLKKIQRNGTRHAAALGLAELTNALCLVVSEEHGHISLARHGDIQVIPDVDQLTAFLNHFYDESFPSKQPSPVMGFFRKNLKEKLTAVVLTMVLWFVFVHESRLTYQRFAVPVTTINLDPGLTIREIKPQEVEVTISGKRSAFYFFNKKEIRLFLNMWDEGQGPVTKQIQDSEIVIPQGMSLESVSPRRIRISVLPKGH